MSRSHVNLKSSLSPSLLSLLPPTSAIVGEVDVRIVEVGTQDGLYRVVYGLSVVSPDVYTIAIYLSTKPVGERIRNRAYR